jgi:hypothetical protein
MLIAPVVVNSERPAPDDFDPITIVGEERPDPPRVQLDQKRPGPIAVTVNSIYLLGCKH